MPIGYYLVDILPQLISPGSDFGGVWYWNRYPGARVDSETPFYQLNIPEVYKTWSFSQRFPNHTELRRYIAHIDKTLGLRKDVTFDAKVNSSTWDASSARWTVTTENGLTARAQFLILATGLLHKAHMPTWPGREAYKGEVLHTGAWREDLDLKSKKVAVIGSGATSVQVVQELAKEVSQLTVLLRRPSFCLPMRQRTWTEQEQTHWKPYYASLFKTGRNSLSGFPLTRRPERVQDVTAEEREACHEELWASGAFSFLSSNFCNLLTDPEANTIMYDFWKRKVSERLTDPVKQQLMAPDVPPYYFGTKRTPLEHDYYDVLNQDNVDLVDLNKHPIEGFTESGLQLGGGVGARDFDVVVAATGFDAFTGSLVKMGLKSKDGVDLREVWKDGVKTYLGMTIRGFPNAFMVYSPQAPTALSNGPTIIGVYRHLLLPAFSFLDICSRPSATQQSHPPIPTHSLTSRQNAKRTSSATPSSPCASRTCRASSHKSKRKRNGKQT